MKIQDAIQKTIEGGSLTLEEAHFTATEIMEGRATDAQIAGLLMTLRLKGESIDEITGFAQTMREKATAIPCASKHVVDTCGTGGDGSGSFNISTVSAIVAAGAGCSVAKHGNRSVSSRCGSADVLKALGVKLEITPEKAAACIDQAGIGFLFAPLLHSAMKYAIGPRRELGVRTIFNMLGPLTNPADAKRQVMGVYSKDLTEPIANVLKNLGSEHVLVVHGEDGLDEITLTGKTKVSELKDGAVHTYDLDPESLGLKAVQYGDLKGGDPEANADTAIRILKGEKGAKMDTVVLNAGAVIYTAGMAESIEAGMALAEQSILSGAAMERLEKLKEMTNDE
ncbi:anthranilate phosphoribosyltransferase [bacterium]|nr:anthranilate phosphoribosyltransferase [bacterium]